MSYLYSLRNDYRNKPGPIFITLALDRLFLTYTRAMIIGNKLGTIFIAFT